MMNSHPLPTKAATGPGGPFLFSGLYRVRDLNPCYWDENPASWTGLDELGVIISIQYSQKPH